MPGESGFNKGRVAARLAVAVAEVGLGVYRASPSILGNWVGQGLINDEQLRAAHRARAMRFGVVGNLITHSGGKYKLSAIG